MLIRINSGSRLLECEKCHTRWFERSPGDIWPHYLSARETADYSSMCGRCYELQQTTVKQYVNPSLWGKYGVEE